MHLILSPAVVFLLLVDTVHPIDGRVEHLLFTLTDFLDIFNIFLEPSQGHFVDRADGLVRVITFVGGVVVHGEGALGS